MGKRGPRPKPTALRLLHGDRPARTNLNEPRPGEGPPSCPDGVTDEVRAVWAYTLDQLIIMGVATPADQAALLCFCEAVVTHRRASAILAKSNVLVPGVHKGSVVRNPAVVVQRDAAAVIRAFAHEFGFTPSARSEIYAPRRANRGDPAEEFFG